MKRRLEPAATQAHTQHTPKIRLRRSKGVVPLGGSRKAAQGGYVFCKLRNMSSTRARLRSNSVFSRLVARSMRWLRAWSSA